MSQADAVTQDTDEHVSASPTWRERVLSAVLARALDNGLQGNMTVRLPSGRRMTFGDGQGTEAVLILHSLKPVWTAVSRGALGLAESYMAGDVDSPDLAHVLRFVRDNHERIFAIGGGIMKPRWLDRIRHRLRDNSRAGSRRNIKAHYDLGNDFYKAWLDPGMTYSSGIYRSTQSTLDEAQAEKYDVVLRNARAGRGTSILEIGCGWGGLTEAAATLGSDVDAITVSRAQFEYATDRIAKAALPGKANIKFQDYRDVDGTYDAIMSVEMIEAVGEAHWPQYFKTLCDRLKPGGRAVIQAITIDEAYFDAYRREPDFIQRYVFPGGMLPTVAIMSEMAATFGLKFSTIERFGESYAKTLCDWRVRFHRAWPDIKSANLDQRFRRLWDFYLTYCEVGFEAGDIDVGIYVLEKIDEITGLSPQTAV